MSEHNEIKKRALSEKFLTKFNSESGIYNTIVKRVQSDKELDLEFRGDYIDIYYQGHSILKLNQSGRIEIDEAFKRGIGDKLEGLKTNDDVRRYLELLPFIKDNVAHRVEGKRNRELEFEQLLIRANNRESTNNSEYIIIDRQYVVNRARDRWDLVALRYPSKGKPKGFLSIIEVKYAQNSDIQRIKEQVERYGQYLNDNFNGIREDMCEVLAQKLELRLITRSPERIKWLRELCLNKSIDQNIKNTEIIIYLIDYNRNSKLINLAQKAGEPNFQGKVRIGLGGLAIWQANLTDFGENYKQS